MKMRTDVPPFAMVFRADLETPEIRNLTGSEFRVWVALCSFCAPGSAWQVSVSLVCDVLGMNRRTVQRAMATLERSNLVAKAPKKHKRGGDASNEWVVRHPGVTWTKGGRSDDRPGERSSHRRGERSSDRPRGRQGDRSPTHTPSVENGPAMRRERMEAAVWDWAMDPDEMSNRQMRIDMLADMGPGAWTDIAHQDDIRRDRNGCIGEAAALGATLEEWNDTAEQHMGAIQADLSDLFKQYSAA